MAWSTTPTPPMRAAWTHSGGCTRGSTARRRGATRRVCGGATTTGIRSAESYNDVDADARTDVDGRRRVVRRHVGRDDGGDDAAIARPRAVALSPDDRRSADGARRRRISL